MRRYHQSLECEHMPARRRAFDVWCRAWRHIIDKDAALCTLKTTYIGSTEQNPREKARRGLFARPVVSTESEACLKSEMGSPTLALLRWYTLYELRASLICACPRAELCMDAIGGNKVDGGCCRRCVADVRGEEGRRREQ